MPPSPVAPNASVNPPSPRLKVLHVGVANRGRWPLERATVATGFESVGLCDRSETALAEARRLTGLPASACHQDLDTALAATDADCVIICAPTVFHVPMVERVVASGRAALVEKGMAPNWAEARRLAAFVRERGGIAAVAQNYRYQAHERTILRALRDPGFFAYLGPVHQVSYSQQRVRPQPGTLTYPFACVWDMSCHHLDTLGSWLGPLEEVTAFSWRAGWTPYEHDANTAAHFVHAGGARVHYLHTHDAARTTLDVELHGERGALFWRDDTLTFSARPAEQFGARPAVPVPLEAGDGLGDLLRDFHAYVTRGIEPGISVRQNLEVMAACELMVRSITQRRPVRREELDREG